MPMAVWPSFERLQRQLARMRAAAQEAVVGRDLQLGVHGSGGGEFVDARQRHAADGDAFGLQRLQEGLVGC